MKAHVGLTPISADNAEELERAKDLINKKPPTIIPEAKIEKMNQKLSKFITEKLELYESTWKNEKNFKHLSADMAIPEELL